MNSGEDKAGYGWGSSFPEFHDASPASVRDRLEAFVRGSGASQKRAWADSIPILQREVGEVLADYAHAHDYGAVLEYELPLESRRPDVLILTRAAVAVLELKGKSAPSQADLDQTAAYARDLRCYHRDCATRPVLPICVPMLATGYLGERHGVHVAGPDFVDRLIGTISQDVLEDPLDPAAFLDRSAYCPLPTLVQAARELFESHTLRRIHRAHAATQPAIEEIKATILDAASTKSRKLILLTGVPGAGKTLVGLSIAHAHFLDALAIPRPNGTSTAPAVFLSGNGPLVQVLQYELRGAGGGGKTFVRAVKDYVTTYSSRTDLVPPEHVLVFDEAQRAFDAHQVQAKHANTPGFQGGKSEPEHFIEFAERIPGWCVVVGLIGTGQEIHVGEEAGLVQWRDAIEGSSQPSAWEVHGPPSVEKTFKGGIASFASSASLSLDTELRFHFASNLHRLVGQILDGAPPEVNDNLAALLDEQGYHLRITRLLAEARDYLRERYADNPGARYGLLASSRDKDLVRFQIPNDWGSTQRVRYGPWYGDAEDAAGGYSCRHLRDAVTEFGAQGLELDAVLLAWGTDLTRVGGKWSNAHAKRYQSKAHVVDPFQLRLNAYRVLLTRGRDATVAFVPPLGELDETYSYLCHSGFKDISA